MAIIITIIIIIITSLFCPVKLSQPMSCTLFFFSSPPLPMGRAEERISGCCMVSCQIGLNCKNIPEKKYGDADKMQKDSLKQQKILIGVYANPNLYFFVCQKI